MQRILLIALAVVMAWFVAMYALSLVAGVVFTLVKFVLAAVIAVVAVKYALRRFDGSGSLPGGRRRRVL